MIFRIPRTLRKNPCYWKDISPDEEAKFYTNRLIVCAAIFISAILLIMTRLATGSVLFEFGWVVLLYPFIRSETKHSKYALITCMILLLSAALILLTPLNSFLKDTKNAIDIQYLLMGLFSLSVVCCVEVSRHRMRKELTIVEEELQSLAFRDQLTKSYNRHALILHFGDLFASADGHSFALLDLDDFKAINDTYGHFVGDDVLCHVTNVIQMQLPSDGCLYRWGGEEFLIIVNEMTQLEFIALLEKVRTAIHCSPLYHNGIPIYTTSSFGAICVAHDASIQNCLMQADKQLYLAKRNGKNQVSYSKAS